MADHVELRITVGVVLCWVISELASPMNVDERSLEWCAYTVIMIAAPTLGSVVVKGSDRLIGTVLGGLFSVAVCSVSLWYWWLVLATSTVAAVATFAGDYLKKDYSMKLFVLTFIMICIGVESGGLDGIIDVAVTRTMGIAMGNIMVTVLTILLWPAAARTSSIKCVRSSLETLQQLQVSVWENGAVSTGWSQLTANESFRVKVDERYIDKFLEPPVRQGGSSVEGLLSRQASLQSTGSGRRRLAVLESLTSLKGGEFSGMGTLPLNSTQDMDEMEDGFEKRIDSITSALSTSEQLAVESRAEIYVGSLRGWPVFLPGLDGVQIGWPLPTNEITALNNTIRKLIRLYWSLQRSFQEGFDDEMMSVIACSYPPCMLSTMQDGAIAVIQSILDAFPQPGQLKPACKKVRLEALVTFCTEVRDFLEIGAEQRQHVRTLLHRINTANTYSGPRRGDLDSLKPWRPDVEPPQPSGEGSGAQSDGSLGSALSLSSRPASKSSSDASHSIEHSLTSLLVPARRQRSVASALNATLALPRNKTEQHLAHQASMDSDGENSRHGARYSSTDGDPQPSSQEALPDTCFPETANGRIAKVRWYSFLFQLERVAIALVDLVEDADDLLCKLPT
mmetsp:Transcript_1306/g.3748  ORF Transcript_1306/g.3748 Transcript_1306/m.3748 type:complete len:621 (-) Transcript_1306:158-2020(-)